jgi:1,4-alpha-glucan branching enzyme
VSPLRLAVTFDVVYNHAGGFFGDDQSLYFWDRAADTSDNNQSLYFTNMGLAGGLSFALWNDDVREFIINSARYYIQEFHVDGFRYDEISALLSMNQDSDGASVATLAIHLAMSSHDCCKTPIIGLSSFKTTCEAP